MRNKKTKLFASIICLVYIAAVLFYIFSLAAEYIKGPETVEERLSELTRETSRNLNVNEIGSEAFSQGLLRSMGNVADIAALQIVCGGKLYFSYPSDPNKTSAATSSLVITRNISLNTNDGQPVQFTVAIYRLKPSSIFYKGRIAFFVVLAATVFCIIYLAYMYIYSSVYEEKEDDDNGALDETDDFGEDDSLDFEEGISSMAASSPKEENDDEKTELFIPEGFEAEAEDEHESFSNNMELDIAAPAEEDKQSEDELKVNIHVEDNEDGEILNSDKTFLAENPEDNEDALKKEDLEGEDIDFDVEEDDDSFFSEILNDEEEIEGSLQQEDKEESDDIFSDDENENIDFNDNNDDLNFDDDIISENSEPVVSFEEENKQAEAAEVDNGDTAPHGLFNPVTDFGWEEYMQPRLDSELVRAASSEQDLALFTVKIIDLDWYSTVAKELSQIIIETAKFKDLVFDHDKDGCSIIILGQNVEDALKTAEELHLNLISHLSKQGMYNSVAIGISTRSLRLISASRIINESQQALEHALEDKDSPIVAFKVNPEKYRSYLASEGELKD